MNREYVISKRSKITYYVLAGSFLAIALVLVVVAIKDPNATPAYFIAFFFGVFPPFLIANVIKKRIVTDDYLIIATGLFYNRWLQINDIKGYRIVVNKSNRSIIF
jgi:uncharacterized integral membrane protein